MQLHELTPKHPLKNKKPRVGRGGKRGTTSGHGTKGQKSRSGHRIRPAERDYIQRLPKLRGTHNLGKKKLEIPILNLNDIEALKDLSVISPETVGNAKILGNGKITRGVSVQGLKISKSALKKIEAAGGKYVQNSSNI